MTSTRSNSSLPLSASRRLVLLLVAWGGYFCSSPGVLTHDGWVVPTVAAIALWGAVASRPGPRAFWVEALCGCLGWVGLMFWAGYVWPPLLIWIGPGHGLYIAVTGVVLRRLARVLPLALAVPLAWVGLETVRTIVPTPFGLESLQLGHSTHAWTAFAGSARVWGLGGLGIAFGALAGLVADVARARGVPSRAALGWGLGLPGLALALAWLVPAPALVDGPRVLLVQPAFEQTRKQFGNRYDNHRDAVALTLEGLAQGPTPDLVLWGETMVASRVFDDEVLEALDRGWEPPAWQRQWLTRAFIEDQRGAAVQLLDQGLFPLLPEGTGFLAGAEVFRWREGEVQRGNAAFLWADGQRSQPALKIHTVPGAESMMGLERFAVVRDAVYEIAGYVPNLVAGERTEVLEFTARNGRTWRMGASICFDNAFLDPYTEPLRRGPLDFHVLLSNEAWYRHNWEAAQMLAYSRVAALATARSMVRATNSGISAVVSADGSSQRLGGEEVPGTMLRGTLTAAVPVPSGDPEAAPVTPFVRTEGLWTALWLLGPLAGLLAARRQRAREEQVET